MPTKKYEISVHGCDDSTCIEIDLTTDEFKLVDRIARLISDTSTYSCMPTMSVEDIDGKTFEEND